VNATSVEVAIALELLSGGDDEGLPYFLPPGDFEYRSGMFRVHVGKVGFDVEMVFAGPRELKIAFDSTYIERVRVTMPREEDDPVAWTASEIGTFIDEEINAAVATRARYVRLGFGA
jgi:hypothetical protein